MGLLKLIRNMVNLRAVIVLHTGALLLLTGCKVGSDQEGSPYPAYHRSFHKVEALIDSGDIAASPDLFEVIIQPVDYVPAYDYFTISRAASKASKCKLAATYFRKALAQGLEYEKIRALKDRMGAKAYNRMYGFAAACSSQITVVAQEQHNIQHPCFDKAYKQAIEDLFQKDKAYRGEGVPVHDLVRVDSQNISTLLRLIEQNGFPNSRVVGHETNMHAYVILLHYDNDEENKRLKPILDQAYHNGYLGPKGIAWIVDRRRAWGPKMQAPYYYFLNKESCKYLSFEEKCAVDFRRDSIGLSPLE
jgi:hypothetical protein